MIAFRLPDVTESTHFLKRQAILPYTYPTPGATSGGGIPKGFDDDRLRVVIGHGFADFAQARGAIRQWRMFPDAWTRIVPGLAPIRVDTVVAMYARVLGLWWRNACRIVYTVDTPERFGFAYGTLPGHVERGEELFWVGIEPDGTVWYEIRAFSRPRHGLAWLGYPLVRYLQARFRRHSAAQVAAFVQQKQAAS